MDIKQGIELIPEPDEGLVPALSVGSGDVLLLVPAKRIVPSPLLHHPSSLPGTRGGRGRYGSGDLRCGDILQTRVKG